MNKDNSTKGSRKTKTLFVDGVAVGEVEATGDREKDIEIARKFLKDRGLHKKVTLVQAMFRQAVSFASTANYVYERDLKNLPRNILGIAPFVVNSAFSIEVYLKTVHQIQGNSIKGHSLSQLYDSLSNEQKSIILAAANKYSSEYNLSTPVPFRDLVAELNNSFIEWRYLYEKERTGEVKILPTIFIMKVLHEVCRQTGKT